MKFNLSFTSPVSRITGSYKICLNGSKSGLIKYKDDGDFDVNLKKSNYSISFNIEKSKEEGSLIIKRLNIEGISSKNKVFLILFDNLIRKTENVINHILMEFMFEDVAEISKEIQRQTGGETNGILGEKICI